MNGHHHEHSAGGVLLQLPMQSCAPARVRVLIVDSRRLQAEALMFALDSGSGCEGIGYALNGLDALELLADLEPDVVVIGPCLPDLDGGDLVHLARQLCPRIRVVLVGDHVTDDALATFVPESSSAAELLEAIAGCEQRLLRYGDA